MDIQKIRTALKERNFWWKTSGKLRDFLSYRQRVFVLKEERLRAEARRARCYRRLMREFGPVLDQGVQCGKPQKSNKVWICWFQGFEQAPELIRACLHSVEQNLPDREIVLLTNENLHQYVQLPDRIEKLYRQGRIGAAHYSDLIRIALISKWGGLWLDATVLCTDSTLLREVKDLPLFVFRQLDLSRRDELPVVASSWLISGWSNQRILLMTQKLLYAYWEKHNRICDYYLCHEFFAMAARKYAQDWEAVPAYNNHNPHMLLMELEKPYTPQRWAQLMKISGIHKLQRYHAYEGNTFYRHILDKYL